MRRVNAFLGGALAMALCVSIIAPGLWPDWLILLCGAWCPVCVAHATSSPRAA